VTPLGFLGVHDLPVVNAILNGLATVLLITGYALIRQGKVSAHHRVMVAAFTVSCVFLVCYLVYHGNVGSVKFDKPGWVRVVYLWILGTHTVLAATVPVLAIITLRRALNAQYNRHRAIAKWTLPIWLYVSVTGVVVYLLLYQVRPRL
jgi:putative membrane protein